ncbi:protein amnionless [Trichonephila clavata]|uniref:Protein amnionless n=1 Tax=Trichonephila clavata TaxID=2740835 RepID=A0A8X6JW54_TRICU|nr:protein amnionless [Trichonephila clavata]
MGSQHEFRQSTQLGRRTIALCERPSHFFIFFVISYIYACVLCGAEMVLPINGELVFPKDAVFNLTGKTAQGSCVGQDAQFKPIVDDWYNPDNWNITSDRAYPRFPSRRNNAVPHAYRVPCTFDSVQFPPQTSFSVQGINPAPTITSLRINDLEYNKEDLAKLLASSTGKLLFHNNPTINIINSPCSNPTGCICGNERPPVFFHYMCLQISLSRTRMPGSNHSQWSLLPDLR